MNGERRENILCASDRCQRTSQPHVRHEQTYECRTCGSVKHRQAGVLHRPQAPGGDPKLGRP